MTIHRSDNIKNIPLQLYQENKKTKLKKKISTEAQNEINALKFETKKLRARTDKRSLKIKGICKAIRLVLEGNNIQDVANEMNVSRNTITNYMKKYKENKKFMFELPEPNKSELERYEFIIEDLFNRKHIKNYSEAQREVEKEIIKILTLKGLDEKELNAEVEKIKISHTQFKNFLKQHDFKLNYKGYLYHHQTLKVKARKYELIKPIKKNNDLLKSNNDGYSLYLEENKEKISMEITRICINQDIKDMSKIIKLMREKYPQITDSDTKLKKFINEETSL